MPNWNANNMIVQGKGKDVKQFILDNFMVNKNPYSKDDEYAYILDFEKFDPTPLNEVGEVFDDWYTWRLRHWGCKWSPSFEQCISLIMEEEGKEIKIVYDDRRLKEGESFSEEFVKNLDDNSNIKMELTCYFETPWGPPEGIFMQWHEKYKEFDLEVTLKFYEPGCVFAGEMWFSKEEYYVDSIDDSNTFEWIKYLLTEGWESIEWYIDECSDMINEMEEVEVANQLVPKIEDMLNGATVEQAATLISDIIEKYMKWMHEPKEGEVNEQSKE